MTKNMSAFQNHEFDNNEFIKVMEAIIDRLHELSVSELRSFHKLINIVQTDTFSKEQINHHLYSGCRISLEMGIYDEKLNELFNIAYKLMKKI